MIRNAFVIICILSVSGCGIVPAWVTIASTGADAILSVSTGKSSGEHGLSMITGKNCQFIHVIDGASICMGPEAYTDYLMELNCDIYTWNILNKVSCKNERISDYAK